MSLPFQAERLSKFVLSNLAQDGYETDTKSNTTINHKIQLKLKDHENDLNKIAQSCIDPQSTS